MAERYYYSPDDLIPFSATTEASTETPSAVVGPCTESRRKDGGHCDHYVEARGCCCWCNLTEADGEEHDCECPLCDTARGNALSPDEQRCQFTR